MLVAIPEQPETSPTPVTSSSGSAGSNSNASAARGDGLAGESIITRVTTKTRSPPIAAHALHGKFSSSFPASGKAGGAMLVSPVDLIHHANAAGMLSKFSEIREDAESGTGGNSILLRHVMNESNGTGSNGMIPNNSGFPMMEPVLQDHSFQQQLLQLKQEQELQHQMLLQRFQAQRQQLAQAHEKQLQQRLKVLEFWEQKRRQDEERERLEALKKKANHEQSAVASSEVKQKLQGFILNKKQREAAALHSSNSNLSNSGLPLSPAISTTNIGGSGSTSGSNPNIPGTSNVSPPFRTWSVVHAARVAAANSEYESHAGVSASGAGGVGPFQSHPYRRPLMIPKYDDDFPLRKTASEPNLLKMKLKQRVLERRCSPLVRRKERSSYIKRRSHLATEGSGSAGSTPDSGPNSPPIGSIVGDSAKSSGGSGDRTPQHDDGTGRGDGSPYRNAYGAPNSVCDLTLYSSPSLPNISLGRPLPPNAESKLAAVSETEVRGPLPPQAGPIPPYPLQFYTPHGPIDTAELEALYQSGGIMALAYQAQAAQAHAEMTAAAANAAAMEGRGPGRRPLGRTQSAPLPLGHPMLVLGGAGLVNVNGIGIGAPTVVPPPVLDPQQAHQLLRQHIRQTVLTRAGSRGQVMVGSHNRAASVEEDSGEGEAENEISSAEKQRAALNKQQAEGQPQDLSSTSTTNSIPSSASASAISQRLHHLHHHQSGRPLSRTLSSPLVALGSSPQDGVLALSSKPGGTGLGFDSLMLKHQCLCGDNSQHPEHPGRLQSIWARLQETGLASMCDRIRTRKATLEEIQSCHSQAHTLLFGTNPLSRQRIELNRFPEASLPIKSLVRLPCNGIGVDSDTAWNELHTPSAARMAAGCVLELAFRVATGDLRNGFAVVRPPGHHAEPMQAMGFCFFNSVAIAARQLRNRLQLEKILLVDWDVHHGNGTQQIFYDDPHVLYLSLHRHDDGNFFPGTGGPTECGIEDGMGFNVNIGWGGALNPPMGDAEYMAAFRSIVMPVAHDYQPDIILVSCGFDAAMGHPAPLGGYKLSPALFGWMTQQLMAVTNGKVVLALEGGYDLPAICDSAQECVKALLGEPLTPISEEELLRQPCKPAIETLLRTIAIQSPHWPCIKPFTPLINCSAVEASGKIADGKILRERVESETVPAMASLSMRYHPETSPAIISTRRRESDNKMNEETIASPDVRSSNSNLRGGSEEPMEQDDEPTK